MKFLVFSQRSFRRVYWQKHQKLCLLCGVSKVNKNKQMNIKKLNILGRYTILETEITCQLKLYRKMREKKLDFKKDYDILWHHLGFFSVLFKCK